MTFAEPGDYFETDEEGECRDCETPTYWTDNVAWICPPCHARETGDG